MERKLAMLEDILNAIPLAVFLLDQNLCTTYINRKAIQTFNILFPEQCLGKRPGDVVACLNSTMSPEGCGYSQRCSQCSLRSALLDALHLGKTTGELELEYRFATPDTILNRWFVATVTPVEVLSAKHIILSVGEITKRKQLENHLADEKRRASELLLFLQEALKAAKAGMNIVDTEFNLIYADPHFEEIYGSHRGKKCYQYFRNESSPCKDCTIPVALEEKRVIVTERVLPKEGNRVVEVHTIPHKTPDGSLVALEFMFDITARKEMEKNLLQANQMLKDALEAAEKANKAKSIFLSKVSHELRTPLNVIIGMAGILAESVLDPELKEYSQMIGESGQSLLSVISDILDLTRIEADKLIIEKSICNIRKFMESTVAPFAVQAEQKGLLLTWEVRGNVPPAVVIDHYRVRQVLNNLLSNAIKYTERGSITVTVENLIKAQHEELTGEGPPALLRFEVRDTGIGIPPDKTRYLFQPFAQLDDSEHRKREGTGLGLAVSQKLVELMGGAIGVESELGVGSAFYFTLPADTADLETEDIPCSLIDAKTLQKIRVLVVDDNKANQLITEKMLSQYGITDVKCVSSGSEALTSLRMASEEGKPFDVVLLDEIMLEMDGLKVAELIRQDNAFHHVGIIILSSGMEDLLRHKEYERLGIAARLTKPVLPSRLYDSLCKIMVKKLRNPRAGGSASPAGQAGEPGGTVQKETRPLEILLAEDKIANQKLVELLLRKRGHNVTVAADGREALEMYAAKNFDLILMDLGMPEMDGLEATRKIRAYEKTHAKKRTPVVALTAYAMKEDIEKCFAAGMDGYLSKPVNAEELYRVLDNFAARCPRENSEGVEQKAGNFSEGALDDIARDVIKLMHSLGGYEGQTAQILEIFIGEAKEELQKIMSHLKNNDIRSALAAAHGLKGEAGNLGLSRAFELAKNAEALLKNHSVAEAREKFFELEEEVRRLEKFLSQPDWKEYLGDEF